MHKIIKSCYLCLSLIIFSALSFNAEAVTQEKNMVSIKENESITQEFLKALKASQSQEQIISTVTEFVDNNADFNEINRYTLGRYYRQATSEQWNKLTDLHKKKLVNTLLMILKSESTQSSRIVEAREGERVSTVKISLSESDKDEFFILIYRANSGKLINLESSAMFGASVFEALRSRYSGLLNNGGIPAVLLHMSEHKE